MTDQFSPRDADHGPREDSGSSSAAARAHGGGAPRAAENDQAGTSSPAPELSPAVSRFRSCRWRRPPEDNGGIECCGHRDVLPLAGSTSFDPEAWCPDCAFYKLRRTPKKREYPY